MTEQQVKEALSRGYVRLVASRSGFKCNEYSSGDHGVDLVLAEVAERDLANGGRRLTETGRYIDLQLKCTTEVGVIWEEDQLAYDLEAKTYNDLVARMSDVEAAPLVLVVFVLPVDEDGWLVVTRDALTFQKTGYWWRPEDDAAPTSNTASVRIRIPYSNHAGLDFAPQLYSEFYS